MMKNLLLILICLLLLSCTINGDYVVSTPAVSYGYSYPYYSYPYYGYSYPYYSGYGYGWGGYGYGWRGYYGGWNRCGYWY